jgi:hypothetical protein
MNILELLGEDNVWIQGHHTRLVIDSLDGIRFSVYAKDSDDRYTVDYYHGEIEKNAVESFLLSENS